MYAKVKNLWQTESNPKSLLISLIYFHWNFTDNIPHTHKIRGLYMCICLCFKDFEFCCLFSILLYLLVLTHWLLLRIFHQLKIKFWQRTLLTSIFICLLLAEVSHKNRLFSLSIFSKDHGEVVWKVLYL